MFLCSYHLFKEHLIEEGEHRLLHAFAIFRIIQGCLCRRAGNIRFGYVVQVRFIVLSNHFIAAGDIDWPLNARPSFSSPNLWWLIGTSRINVFSGRKCERSHGKDTTNSSRKRNTWNVAYFRVAGRKVAMRKHEKVTIWRVFAWRP